MNQQPSLNQKNRLKVTLVRSLCGRLPKHRATIASLGLKRLGSSVIVTDNKAIRGMLRQVNYLIEKVEE